MIYFDNVTKNYTPSIIGVENTNFEINRGDFVFFTGKSGAGKSTILNLLRKEIEPSYGEIYVNNIKIRNLSKSKIPYFKRMIGFASKTTYLLENKTIYENLEFILTVTNHSTKDIKSNIPKILGIVGLKSKYNNYPKELSGGEIFRITLATALANSPEILILDEPTSNLDYDTSWDIMCILNELNHIGITILVATHAAEFVNLMKKRVITLENGKIISDFKNSKYSF